jgi:hypothetical protein
MYWEAIQRWLADTRLVRRLADTLFRGRARRHLATLDHQSTVRSQARTLRGLVHRAHATRFGCEHDFRRIRTPADFQRLVPLRTTLDFWRDYWGPSFPNLADVTWPGLVPALIGRSQGFPPYLPATTALWASHRAAAWTTLSLVVAARPQARLFSGQLLLLGEGPLASPLPCKSGSGEAEWLELPPRWRPYTLPPLPADSSVRSSEERLQALVERSIRAPLTCLAGRAGMLARFFAASKRESGWQRVADIWPGLAAVLYQREPGEPGLEQLAAEAGLGDRRPPVLFLEACFRPEGAIAVEDPRHGCLRLLVDHGVYFEFVPAEEVGKSRPVRHGIGDVDMGVAYALALTSAAGLWACLAGVRVCFERRNPPLVRVLETTASDTLPPTPAPTEALPRSLLRPLPRRNGSTAAGLPGKAGRLPLSARAD